MRDPAGNLVFDDEGIRKIMYDFFKDVFKGQSTPVHCHRTEIPAQTKAQIQDILQDVPSYKPGEFDKLVSYPYNPQELDRILEELPNGKAAGILVS